MKARRHSAFLVTPESGLWRIARVAGDQVDLRDVPQDAKDPSSEEAALAAALKELDYRGQGVCLGLPSDMVLCSPVETADLPRKRRAAAMLYLLEERLPLEAERLSAEFLPEVAGKSLGLAVETGQVRSLLDRLTRAGVFVAAICPTALLALDGLSPQETEDHYSLVAQNSHVDVFRMIKGGPTAWYTSSPEPSALCRLIKADMLALPPDQAHPRLFADGKVAPELLEHLRTGAGLAVEPQQQRDVVRASALAAASVLEGRNVGWVNFRRNELAPPRAWRLLGAHLKVAAVLLVVTVLALTGAFIARGIKSRMVMAQCQRMQTAQFVKAFPTSQIPPNIPSRLASDLTRLSGLSGANADLPQRTNALATLGQIASSVPQDLRIRLSEIRIGPSEIFIEGQARSHGDPELLAAGLRRSGLAVESPQSQTLPKGGVSFTLIAKGHYALPEVRP